MKACVLLLALSLVVLNVHAKSSTGRAGGSHSVNGYVKKDGTYVEPYRATNPNNTQRDNWSSRPNVNPYTGKQGTNEPQK